MEMRLWGSGFKPTPEDDFKLSPGPYDVYFIKVEKDGPDHSSAYPHFVYWNGFLVAGPLGYNGFMNFIMEFERNTFIEAK